MTEPSLLRVVRIYVREYALAVIAVGLIYGGIHEIVSAILIPIYPITEVFPRFVDAILKSEFRYLPSLSSNFYEPWMWTVVSKMVVVGVIAIVVGILVGLWAHYREQRVTVPNS